MEDTLWSEIADAPGEIWDNIPEFHDFSLFGRTERAEIRHKNELDFKRKLDSNFDF